MVASYKPKRYIKKPVEVEAIKWTGKNYVDVCLFMNREALTSNDCSEIIVYNVDGAWKAAINDYIIKDAEQNFYTCSEAIFLETYKEVE